MEASLCATSIPMKSIHILTLFLVFTTAAQASIESVGNCLNQKYATLTDRDAIAAAVVSADESKLMTFGNAKADSLFEIGSITKTLTGLLLAKSVADGALKVDDTIPTEYQKESSLITFKGLTTHTSGIIGGNFPGYVSPIEQAPYAGITIPLFKKLYAETALGYAPGEQWVYSNIASGLLGLVLSERAQMTYEDLVQSTILSQLQMNDSYFKIPESSQNRFLQGHLRLGDEIEPYAHWDLFENGINPAGGLRSTIKDMMKYARAQLNPSSTSLKSAIELSHQPLFTIPDRMMEIGMNWILIPGKEQVWHNGSTIGFNSILIISKKKNLAVIALSNTGVYKQEASGEINSDESLQEIAFYCIDQ